ncbi:unnamed protein product [Rhizoctonia solani]|uniref:ATP-dependent bile acid permease n=1 Tax=Rhizoctonia solani TaxID=456999 RepID=A0A8H3D1B0_9AGAM|nr:unnamed protein product [Rhizoctonia solani]
MKFGTLGIGLASIDVLETWTPALFFLACTFTVYLIRALCTWKPTRSLLGFFSRPFQSFLTLDDISEYNTSIKRIEVTSTEGKCLRVLCFIQTVGWVFWATLGVVNGGKLLKLAGPVLLAVSWVLQFARLFPLPASAPYILFLFACLNLLSACIDLVYYRPSPEDMYNIVSLMGGIRAIICAAIVFLAGRFPMTPILPGPNVAMSGDPLTSELTSPEDGVSLWSWLTFSFMGPLFVLADERSVQSSESGKFSLNDEDIWSLSPTLAHRNVFRRCLREMKEKGHDFSLLWYLLRANSLDLILDVTLEMYSAVAGFIPPYALQRILRALEQPQDSGVPREAYIWGLVTFIAHMSFAQVDIIHRWHTRRCYEASSRTRGTLFCALHYKALKRRDLSGAIQTDKQDEKDTSGADIGRIVNLMQGDAYAVAQRFWEFSAVFSAPIRLGIALYFLYQVLGWSSLGGVLVVLFAYAINYPLARWNISITRQSWKARDRRMSAVSELLSSLRFLKYMGWESRWSAQVKHARAVELAWRVQENICSVLIAFIWTWVPSAVILVAFTSYTLLAKEPLTVSRAFTAIELFSQLQGPMSQLPQQIFALLHAYVSMQRIQTFLNETEVEDWASSIKRTDEALDTEVVSNRIGLQDATFIWHLNPSEAEDPVKSHANFKLADITLEFPLGRLTLITGATGSGKSSILAALLGEMMCVAGQVYLDKRRHAVSYAGQHPWLEHATIRENILYGLPYNQARYEAVLDACALRPDLRIFPAGDQTEIGEKGVSLSGGQRARCAIARAVYSYSKTVLLDDPLAAVDMHTARHLVDKCLAGPLMQGRTIILVTHHVRMCLDTASYLVELSNGRIIRQGTITELRGKEQLSAILQTQLEDDTTEAESEGAIPPSDAPQINEADVDTGDVDNTSTGTEGATLQHDSNIGKLVDEEARAEGRVSLKTYWTYIKAASVWSWVASLVLLLAVRGITIGSQLFLAKWSEAYGRQPNILSAFTFTWGASNGFWSWLDKLPPPAVNSIPWLLIYLSISLTSAFTVLSYLIIGYWSSLLASRSLFTAMLNRVVRAPSRWLDVTPVGRILNRFVSDIGAVDSALNPSARAALSGTINFIASFLVIVFFVPSFLPFALVIAWLYIRIAPPFVRASRDLRRLESISLSPAFSGFDELLHGLVHVRAFGAESRYQEAFYKKVDRFQKFDHQYWNCSFWLMWRYDCLGSVVVMLGTLFALLSGVRAGIAAVVIVQAGVFAEASRQLVRVFAQLELDFNSVERIGEYLILPQEAPAIIANSRPPAHWPSRTGGITVDHLVMRYAGGLPDVLRDLTFEVKPREKVGVVGRTGSGKSSLALSLLRAVEPSGGRIILDGIDIRTIGLDDLRSRVTLVSQDVALFSGSVRSNLDPFNEYTDEECWDVLERCHLGRRPGSEQDHLSGRILLSTLEEPVSVGGKGLSAGQRQLLALARAMLRRSAVIIMDEATSSIDLETDDQIQHTIREEMTDALVITIAHRLKTIIDYDRVLVLNHGQVAEFDTPSRLMRKEGGIFRMPQPLTPSLQLQTEIDRTLKKVSEGVELFESIYEKMQASTNQTQKEKLETDLKTQIKKLQRLRDQIKTWVASNEIKDKTHLLENRKLIETQMEKFKACEKEMKTKAFSKDGLNAAQKLDPREKEKAATSAWLAQQMEELGRQIEHAEAEIELLQGSTGRSRRAKTTGNGGGRAEELVTLNERRKWHVGRLEIVMRLLENNTLQTDTVSALKEHISYFVESNTGEDFEFDEGVYDELNLDEEEEAFGIAGDDNGSDDEEESVDERTARPPAKEPKSKPFSLDDDSHSKKDESSPVLKKAAPRKQSMHVESKPPPPQPTPAKVLPPTAPTKVTLPPIRYAAAAAAAVKNDSPASKESPKPAPSISHPPPGQSTLNSTQTPVTAATSTPSITAASAVPAPSNSTTDSSTQHSGQRSPSLASSIVSPAPIPPSLPLEAPPGIAPPSQSQPESRHESPVSSRAGVDTSIDNASVSSPYALSSVAVPSAGVSPYISQAITAEPLPMNGSSNPTNSGTNGMSNFPMSSSQPINMPSPLPQQVQAQGPPGFGYGDAPQAQPLAQAITPQQQQQAQQRQLPSSLSDLVSTFEASKEKAARRDPEQLSKALAAGFEGMPQPQDTSKPKYYVPRNPYPSQPYYPQQPLTVLSSPALYSQLDVETLFFVFYYLPGTYMQYLAAKELKRQSWRFHVKYLTWFQRHSEPQAITDEYEQGVYVYFDWEGSWCQRKKSDFRFEYRHLSED